MNNNDDAKAAATWKFIKFLISPESQAYWNAETGYFPVTTAADEEQTFKDNVEQYPAVPDRNRPAARFQAAVRRRTSPLYSRRQDRL